jgi:hypothetical protein
MCTIYSEKVRFFAERTFFGVYVLSAFYAGSFKQDLSKTHIFNNKKSLVFLSAEFINQNICTITLTLGKDKISPKFCFTLYHDSLLKSGAESQEHNYK